ncbi:MAG: hypothetical protein ABSB75_07900 [Candidatus Limnocylindrales bacterium]
MKDVQRRVFERVEEALGYPLFAHSTLMDSLLEVHTEYDTPESNFEDLIAPNVHWQGEGFSGDYHEDPEFAALLEDEQSADILARHFAGLFAFAFGPTTNERHYILLADLNARSDGLECPAYRQATDEIGDPIRGSLLPWYVFASPAEEAEASLIFHGIRFPDDETDIATIQGEADQLIARFPRTASAYKEVIETFGATVPAGPASFADPDGERLMRAHDALLPIADALVARSKGEVASLDGAAEAKCAAVADLEGGFPPAIMVGLLTPALSGKSESAKLIGREILDRNLGVALTRTWARKVLGDEHPFRA